MIEKRTGISYYWSVDNSYELINKISDIKTARSINTFDFSTLYSNLPLDIFIYDSLRSLIIKTFASSKPVSITLNGPLARYVIMRVAHATGMPGTLSPPLTSKETASSRSRHAPRHMRHARGVMHVGIANPQRRGKRSRHSRRMRSPQFYVSGKRPIPIEKRHYCRMGKIMLDIENIQLTSCLKPQK